MKRDPADSVEAQVAAFLEAAEGQRDVPRHVKLRRGDLPFWNGIMSSRARAEWSENDLVIAAQLARCQRDIELETRSLRREGAKVSNARGTPVANPRIWVVEALSRRELAMMRALKLSGVVLGDPRDEAIRRRMAADAERARRETSTADPLLATP